MTTTITISAVTGAELHHQYRGQTNPQDAHVVLDAARRTLAAEPCPEIGPAIPARQYHGHVLTWSIPALRANAANDLLESLAPLAERVCSGYESVWNGNNHIGQYSADARRACDEIAALCERASDEPTDALQVWDAAEWFGGLGSRDAQRDTCGISAATTDAQLAEIIKAFRAEAAAETDGVEGLDEYLTGLRDEALTDLVRAVEEASAYQADADVRRHVVAQLAAGAAPDAAALAASYDAWVEAE